MVIILTRIDKEEKNEKDDLWDEIEDVLQWEAWPPREALPICSTTRHDRYRWAEVFGPYDEGFDALRDDIMLKDNRTYYIAFTKHTFDDPTKSKITWEVIKYAKK